MAQNLSRDMILSQIWVYPLKSARGIRLQQAEIDSRGLKHDRRWMLTDKSGRFISQRKYPKMSLIRVSLTQVGIGFSINNYGEIEVAIPTEGTSKKEKVRIWKDECEALILDSEINSYFSDFLGLECRLVYMPDSTERFVEPQIVAENTIVGFADSYPFLLISEASLASLNEKLDEKVNMNRFRPNLVLKGLKPHEEDTFSKIKISGIMFIVAKPCARCVLITTNQETGLQGKEPLKTLMTYRKFDNKILFGQNLIQLNEGFIQEGESVEVWQ